MRSYTSKNKNKNYYEQKNFIAEFQMKFSDETVMTKLEDILIA